MLKKKRDQAYFESMIKKGLEKMNQKSNKENNEENFKERNNTNQTEIASEDE